MMLRRSFLKFLGAAPAAISPLAADAARMAGLNATALGGYTPMIGLSNNSTVGMPVPNSHQTGEGLAKWLLVHGVPDWVKENMRQRHRVPNALDADLASNRSFSLAAKILIQRERDYDRAVKDLFSKNKIDISRVAFEKSTGLQFWV
ncbi:MAG: hypothetical protein WDN46_17510 [Methylocella sp.]